MDPFSPLTPEEAEAAYDAAEPIPMSDAEIDAIVRRVLVRSGDVPAGEMSDDEFWDYLCYNARR